MQPTTGLSDTLRLWVFKLSLLWVVLFNLKPSASCAVGGEIGDVVAVAFAECRAVDVADRYGPEEFHKVWWCAVPVIAWQSYLQALVEISRYLTRLLASGVLAFTIVKKVAEIGPKVQLHV